QEGVEQQRDAERGPPSLRQRPGFGGHEAPEAEPGVGGQASVRSRRRRDGAQEGGGGLHDTLPDDPPSGIRVSTCFVPGAGGGPTSVVTRAPPSATGGGPYRASIVQAGAPFPDG